MHDEREQDEVAALGAEETTETVKFDFEFTMDRRSFVQVLGAGLMLAVTVPALSQNRGGGGGGGRAVSSRVHIGKDGLITVFSGKIEMGQGARTELAQAAAEELRVPFTQVQMVLGDTDLVPDDGLSAGSRTTPSTMPVVRQGAAAARELLTAWAAKKWNVAPDKLQVADGKIVDPAGGHSLTYADLASSGDAAEALKGTIPNDVTVTPVEKWKVMGTPTQRLNRREMVTGAHKYPSDYTREGMLYGKVLRAPSIGAKLVSVDLAPARAMKDVVAVQDGSFVGVAAPSTWAAQQALQAVAETAKWEPVPQPSSREVYDHLRKNAQMPKNGFTDELTSAAKKLEAAYNVAYVQHAPMETRTALAEWTDGKLTVWTGTQNPFGYKSELALAFRLPNESVRVIVPDFGCGFGGKHTGETAVEAARLAKEAGKPVLVRWTREEEFTWASFRPAAVIDAAATLDDKNKLTSWHFININSGGAAVDTPYLTGKKRCSTVNSNSPLRHGSYRALAAVANNFARECFMDELAVLAGMDPLEFRLAHLDHPRLRPVLEEAAKRFKWSERKKEKNVGIGMACGTEKASYVAAFVEIHVEPSDSKITVRRVTEVFECGAVVNPDNLMAQVQGCIIMGMGPALREEMRFANGKIGNAAFSRYLVPRFADVPELDIHLMNRPDLTSVGGGETPIIAIAPAIANAVYNATGKRIRQMPIRLTAAEEA